MNALRHRYGYPGGKRPTNRFLSPARGAYSHSKGLGYSDSHAWGAAQEAAQKALGTPEGSAEIADYAQEYWRARQEGLSGAASERRAWAVYDAAIQTLKEMGFIK